MRSTSRILAIILAISISPAIASSAGAIRVDVPGSTGQPGLTLIGQSPRGAELHYEMGSYEQESIVVNGEPCVRISLPGVILPNDAGAPDLPGLSRFLAIPEGASARLEIISSQTEVVHGIEISPAPVIPRENQDGPLVYERNAAIYGAGSYYPASSAILSPVQEIRGVDFVILGVTPFQYNPARKELLVYKEIDIKVEFIGGTGLFGEERLRSRFWEPILQQHLMNYATLPQVDWDRGGPSRNGFDYIIISPDQADFIAWADTLKAWRKLQGVSTEVFTTTEIGGTTSTIIENFLNTAYNTWDPAPSAFLILGDYPASGFDRDNAITSPIYNSYCVSDNIYADVNGDHLPDMIHARITGRNGTELGRMINKMLDYERNPVTDAPYYDHPIIAGGWQTERWFILCAETLYGHQANALGKHPVREYAIYSGTPGTVWSTNQNTSIVVNYFGPNGLGYIPATPQHLTDWGGNATRINNDINAGAYLLVHRDHGAENGWGEPAYTNANLAGLHNTMLPFVFSMNCLTGKYDWTSECFTEAFHRMAQGALGLVAASEVSYSFVNDTYVWGMWDTMWPGFMPNYGPYPPTQPFSTEMRTAFGMVSGKYFLQSSSWPYNPGDKTVTYHLFHHHGDAFMTLYSQVPQSLTVTHDDICMIGNTVFHVQADAGALIGLTIDGEIVAVATGTGMPQEIEIPAPTMPGSLRITVTKANYYRYDESVEIIPPSGPYLVFETTRVLDDPFDRDGILDAGEQPALSISLENVGIETTTGVTAQLQTSDPHIAILDGEASYPDIEADSIRASIDPFSIVVAAGAPDGHVAAFTVTVQSNEGTWNCPFSLAIQGPSLHQDGHVLNDEPPQGDGDAVIDPGENFYLQLWLENSGHASTGPITATLATMDPNVQILAPVAECPPIPPAGRTITGAFDVKVLSACPSPAILSFQLFLAAPGGYSATLNFSLDVGAWIDQAETDRGWTLSAPDDNATAGLWVRAEPVGTTYGSPAQQVQPEFDHTPDPAQICFVTGNGAPGGAAGDADVDNGKTTLLTPVFALGNATSATISYWRWYTNNLGNNPGQDYWDVEVTSNGTTWVPLEHTTASANSWNQYTFNLGEHVTLTDQVRIRFVASDLAPGSLVEAAVDDFVLDATYTIAADASEETATGAPGIVACGPNPARGWMTVSYRLDRACPVRLTLHDLAGRRVRTLVNGPALAGIHEVSFDAHDTILKALPSGIYFLRMEADGVSSTRQVTIVR